jgi:hypothetical protein
MKLPNPFSLLVVASSVVSCVTAKTYTDEEKKMRIPTDQVFVIKTDGTKIVGKKLSMPSGFHLAQEWVDLDRQKYRFDSLQNYQDRHAFFAKFGNRWVRQLKRGKISLFWYETATQTMRTSPSAPTQYEYHQHFVFQKGDGQLQELSKEAISELLSDNREAQAKFDAQFKPGQKFLPKQLDNHPKVLFEVIDMYNNG